MNILTIQAIALNVMKVAAESEIFMRKEAEKYLKPVATIVGQVAGKIYSGCQAIYDAENCLREASRMIDIMIEQTGYDGTYPLQSEHAKEISENATKAADGLKSIF